MSPVTKAVETDDEKAPKPGKIEPVSAPAPTAVTVDTVKETASKTEKETKEKTKKDKKRKGEDEVRFLVITIHSFGLSVC
jgi:hypothetical protein